MNIHHFKAPMVFSDVSGNAAVVPQITNFYTNFSIVENYAEYKALFDQYRINKLVFIFTPYDPMASAYMDVSKAVQCRGHLSYVRNHTGYSYSTESQMRESSSYREVPYGKTVKISLKPNVLGEAYYSAVGTAYTPKYGQWIDSYADSATPQYGLTINCQTEDVDFIPKWKVTGFIYFSCKNTR